MSNKKWSVGDKGISVFFEAENPTIDIIFVHGFTGHPERTWTSKSPLSKSPPQPSDADLLEPLARDDCSPQSLKRKASHTSSDSQPPPLKTPRLQVPWHRSTPAPKPSHVCWPRDLLPQVLPTARVLTYGYDTNVRSRFVGPVSKNTVGDHGWDLLCALGDFRRQAPTRPLLFIAHSLGGLVTKIALAKSEDSRADKPHLHQIIEYTVGVFFFGTPHRGAELLGLMLHVLKALAKGLSFQLNDSIVGTLMPGGDNLRTIGERFVTLAKQRNWTVFCFQEEYGLGGLFGKQVVENESSRIGDPSVETARSIARNHMEMVRFSSCDDAEFNKVSSALHFVYNKLLSNPSDERLRAPSASTLSESSLEARQQVEACEKLEARKELMQLLYFDEIDARLLSLKPAHHKTCEWILGKPKYHQWMSLENREDHHGFLWIKGKPGAGKSILMKFLDAKTRLSATKQSGCLVASFFFFAPGEHLEKSTAGVYRSLLWQLLEMAPDLQQVLDDFSSNACKVIRRNGWQIEALKETIAKAIDHLGSRQLCLFIDALDECRDDDVADMVSFFEDLSDRATEDNVALRICFSSRYYPTISLRKGAEIRLDDEEEHSTDITRYINAKLVLKKSQRADDLKGQILEKSAGIFLWVALVIPILNKACAGGRMDQLQKRLNEIPPGLDQLFEMILLRDQESLDDLRSCILWIFFATRPLTPTEYFFALHETGDEDSRTCWEAGDMTPEELLQFVHSTSKGLAEVTKTRSKGRQPSVQFIHESVRDFLGLKNGTKKIWPNLEQGFVGFGHEMLKNRCLAELKDVPAEILVDEAATGPGLSETRPFIRYATDSLLIHSNLAQQSGVTQLEFITRFDRDSHGGRMLWIRLHNLFEPYGIRRYHDPGLLYIFADCGLDSLLLVHPGLSDHLQADSSEERYFKPLAAAIVRKHKAAARVLTAALIGDEAARGIDERVVSSTHRMRTQIADNIDFFKLLLDLDHAPLMEFCLDTYSDSALECKTRGRSFMFLPTQGDSEVEKVGGREVMISHLLFGLINHDEEQRRKDSLDPRSDVCDTPALTESAIRRLMKYRPNLRLVTQIALCRNAKTALHFTTSPTVLSILLKHAPSADLPDDGGDSPLSYLCRNRDKYRSVGFRQELEIMRCLLDHGADPNFIPKKKDSRLPGLYWVVSRAISFLEINGFLQNSKLAEEIILLIEKGADVNRPLKSPCTGKTILHRVADKFQRDLTVAKLLVRHGANLYATDQKGNVPFEKFPETRALLIDYKKQPDIPKEGE
ncbi:hypothetical protein B0T19DRAFT_148254 [Cercophora scortea]|uniref:Nephrocystin 3-like N-terminal domain-containing protein n=1 Tax=Cercophora scortea TaxID=314031 RepID=A0AAE0IZR0_9PEZI|nr:hypothetical protein B0T19DRAFT_148254 [Cercophora scortea]